MRWTTSSSPSWPIRTSTASWRRRASPSPSARFATGTSACIRARRCGAGGPLPAPLHCCWTRLRTPSGIGTCGWPGTATTSPRGRALGRGGGPAGRPGGEPVRRAAAAALSGARPGPGPGTAPVGRADRLAGPGRGAHDRGADPVLPGTPFRHPGLPQPETGQEAGRLCPSPLGRAHREAAERGGAEGLRRGRGPLSRLCRS